jgi:hypothetical protein
MVKATLVKSPLPLSARLFRFAQKRGEDECWPWNGFRNEQGYGMIRYNRKQSFAHRLSYEIHVGPIPDGLLVLHSCDNPCCVNPKHLRPGSHLDNADDMIERNRHTPCPGEANGNAKLTDIDVIGIKVALAKGLSLNRTAAQFKISKRTVLDIKHRRTWRHIQEPGTASEAAAGAAVVGVPYCASAAESAT